MNTKNKLRFILAAVLMLIVVVIVWQLLQSMRSHQVVTNSERARKAGKPLPVSTVVAQKGQLDSLVAAECVAKESARVELSSDVGGSVIKVNAVIGDKVSKGQLLVKLDESISKALYKNTVESERTLETLRDELKPFISDVYKLRDKGIVPITDLLDAIERLRRTEFDLTRVRREKIQASADIKNTEIKSPISGVLTSMEIDVGTILQPYENVVTVSQLDPILLECKFDAEQLSTIQEFDKAEANFAAYPGNVYEVGIEKILPETDEESRALLVEFKLANEKQKLLPGMQAVVRLGKRVEGVKIPAISLINPDGDNANVFVVDDKQKAQFLQISTGEYAEGYVLVQNGLNSGQRVVVAGQSLLQDGDSVNEDRVENSNEGENKTLFPVNRP